MIKRVNVLAARVKIKEGPVLHLRPGIPAKNLICNTPSEQYIYTLDTQLMVPKEHFSLMAASDVCVETLTQDESGAYFNLNQKIVTDKLMSITVRQFIVAPVHDLNKEVNTQGFCVLDLAY